jgi:hypothetical protein
MEALELPQHGGILVDDGQRSDAVPPRQCPGKVAAGQCRDAGRGVGKERVGPAVGVV